MSGRKKIAQDESTDDIVCGLPKNLIDNILERLPIKDAARTSILSKNWRYLWSARTTLVFDEQFFEMNFRNKLNPECMYMIFISNILLLRTESVLKFTLYIPNLSWDWNLHIDKYLSFLSRNGINELNLLNMSVSPFQLPSCVFSCPTLKVLWVSNCLFKPPKSVSNFANLKNLLFQKMAFAPDIFGDFVPVLPCLKNLVFFACRGIGNFEIVAPKLTNLCASNSHDVKSFSLDKFPNLSRLSLGLGNQTYDQGREILFNLDNFLKKFRHVTRLELNGPFLKLSAVTVFDRRLSFTFRYLKRLGLHWLRFDDPDQISCALCLLRSLPSLEILEVTALPSTLESESVSRHLEAPNFMDEMLKLQMVKFVSMSCSKPELLFVKGILTLSPSLHTMHFECINNKSDDFKILNELLRFRRASSQAEVIYSCGTLASVKSVRGIGSLFPLG